MDQICVDCMSECYNDEDICPSCGSDNLHDQETVDDGLVEIPSEEPDERPWDTVTDAEASGLVMDHLDRQARAAGVM